MADFTYTPNPSLQRDVAFSPQLGEALGVVGGAIAGRARELAPRLTGALVESIESDTELAGEGWEAVVTANVPYATYVEHGTSDTPAQPFLRPAGDEVVS